jgi:hypothetical protein
MSQTGCNPTRSSLHKLGRNDVTFNELSTEENGDYRYDPYPVGPELRDRNVVTTRSPESEPIYGMKVMSPDNAPSAARN